MHNFITNCISADVLNIFYNVILARVIYCNQISQLYRIQRRIVGYYIIIPTNVWYFIINYYYQCGLFEFHV